MLLLNVFFLSFFFFFFFLSFSFSFLLFLLDYPLLSFIFSSLWFIVLFFVRFMFLPLPLGTYPFIICCCCFCSASPKPHPSKPHPCNMPQAKTKLRCNFRNAALQKLHCNTGFSAVQKSFGPEAALQQTKNCTATSKKLRCRKVALSCRFPAGFKPPRLGTHV